MKTININDELHARLKIASEFCEISIQDLVTEMLERDFNNAINVKEFTIDSNDMEYYYEQIQDYLTFKNIKEGEFKVTMTAELFKKPKVKIYHK